MYIQLVTTCFPEHSQAPHNDVLVNEVIMELKNSDWSKAQEQQAIPSRQQDTPSRFVSALYDVCTATNSPRMRFSDRILVVKQ